MTASEDSLSEAVRELKGSIDKLRDELVRKDVYESDQRRVMDRVQVVEGDVSGVERRLDKQEDDRKADRRLVLTAFILPILVAIIMLYIATQIGPPQ